MKKKRKEQEALNIQSTRNSQQTNFSSSNDLKQGDRVFHSKFGVGKVLEIKDISSSTTIIVDFGSQGQKAMDLETAQLKKF